MRISDWSSDVCSSDLLSTAMSFLGLYRDPIVAATISACDWRIVDLVDASRPVSLYLVIPPADISRTKPLVRLVLNQIGRRLTEKLEGDPARSEEHTSELQSLMRISYAVFCLKKKNHKEKQNN